MERTEKLELTVTNQNFKSGIQYDNENGFSNVNEPASSLGIGAMTFGGVSVGMSYGKPRQDK
ncbi:hypothetical protein S1OALGB6SA_842 [Olavius algarvensis spirochete endosymbiont]|uniref:hypothetical protein n=1 Tax=Olavius algarvensis spirochete endosymbiont TaxID=260710 RepID=UPI000F2D7945|nr:hypothetical protein [Olavius algarvensis spirochete endosymbiont]CAD7837749.1 MAG: hypothetical protein [Olavius algarvensis spirochete endosymbiont]VDA99769.1 hypothetical protein S1OALGB6SA_842 [Olavius algarvensis spirochete endosymbiont]